MVIHKEVTLTLKLVSFSKEEKKEDALWVLTIPELQFSVAGLTLRTLFMRASSKIKDNDKAAKIQELPF